MTDSQKTALKDLALGKTITSQLSIDAQIGAIREQLDLLLAANPKVTICDNYKNLTAIVSTEKEKRKTTVDDPHEKKVPKKNANRSSDRQ